jgi:hypothetical protein
MRALLRKMVKGDLVEKMARDAVRRAERGTIVASVKEELEVDERAILPEVVVEVEVTMTINLDHRDADTMKIHLRIMKRHHVEDIVVVGEEKTMDILKMILT